jgi:hypothetical protein
MNKGLLFLHQVKGLKSLSFKSLYKWEKNESVSFLNSFKGSTFTILRPRTSDLGTDTDTIVPTYHQELRNYNYH